MYTHCVRSGPILVPMEKAMTHDELQSLQVGDVVRISKSGSLRVCREISRHDKDLASHHKAGDVRGVVFTIKRCSWTRRGDTYVVKSDLKRFYQKMGIRVRLNSEFDRKFSEYCDSCPSSPMRISCCEVKGIA